MLGRHVPEYLPGWVARAQVQLLQERTDAFRTSCARIAALQAAGTAGLALDDRIDELGQLYQDVAVAGLCPAGARATFLEAGQQLIDKGAEAVVLAGTDLNLAFDGQSPGYRVIDALDVHVARLADLATDRATL